MAIETSAPGRPTPEMAAKTRAEVASNPDSMGPVPIPLDDTPVAAERPRGLRTRRQRAARAASKAARKARRRGRR